MAKYCKSWKFVDAMLPYEKCEKYDKVVLCGGKIEHCEEPIKREFNQERALRILEHFASGNYNVIMDYNYHTAQAFYSSSKEFTKAKGEYREALEKEFGGKIEK